MDKKQFKRMKEEYYQFRGWDQAQAFKPERSSRSWG
jgi:aldehyde:ferredoxin oxidoreductase